MSRRVLYPVSTWVVGVLALPLTLMALGIAVVVIPNLGDLRFDNQDLWWLGGTVPLAGLLFLYGFARRRRAMARFTSVQLAPLLAAKLSPGRQALRAGLTVLAVGLLAAAILGPRWGVYLEKQKVRGVDIAVAVDVSRSMLTADVEPNRLDRAKREIRQQLIERAVFKHANRLALLAFAGTASLKVPLSTDHLAFRTQLERLGLGSAPRGGTAIAKAVQRATDLFAHSPEEATKILFLLTDGEDHEGGPVEAATEAYRKHGIKVFTIGVGDPGRTVGAQVPTGDQGSGKPLLYDGQIVFSKLDVAALEEIATAGGGRYARIEDLYELVNAVSAMWKANLTTEERERYRPRYQWFVAFALLLLGLETIISERRPVVADVSRRLWQEEEER